MLNHFNVTVARNKTKEDLELIWAKLCFMVTYLYTGFMMVPLYASAAGTSAAITSAVNVVVDILRTVTGVGGGIALVVGMAQFAMASQEDGGPQEQRAIAKIRGGIAAVVVAILLTTLKTTIISIITGVMPG